MAPPTKPPSTPQSNTLFNYFNRSAGKTPTSTSTTPAGSLVSTPFSVGCSGVSSNRTPQPSSGSKVSKNTSSASKTPAPPTPKQYEGETPKKSGVEKQTPRRRRIQRIDSDSEDDENQSPKEKEDVVEKKKVSKKAKNDDDEDEVEWKPSKDVDEDDEEYDEDDDESGEYTDSGESDYEEDESEPSPSCSTKTTPKSGGSGIKRKSVDSPTESAALKKLKTFSAGSSTPSPAGSGMFRPPLLSTLRAKDSPDAQKKGKNKEEIKIPFTMGSGAKTPIMGRHVSDDGEIQWPHLQWTWLKPENRRDGKKRRMSDENYDPTTLDVPASFLNEQTPVQRQWWEIKRKYFDTVLLFKMGKFYELFHMDSVTAVQELGFSFMKGEYAHAGFPEKVYAKHAYKLVELGYKIARIEQTETPEMMNNRIKANKQKGRAVQKYDHVVNREVCQITTRGVRTASVQDDPRNTPFNPEAIYLYCIYQKKGAAGSSDFGVCFIDTTIGEFRIGQFEDDRYFSRLRTLFSHCPPAHVLLQRGNIMHQADQLISSFAKVRKETFSSHFPTHEKVLARLREDNYFGETSTGDIDWPDALKLISDPGQVSSAEGWDLAWKAFGFVVQYLKTCFVDHDLLSLKRFSLYHPVDSLQSSDDVPMPSNMVLDAVTLKHLDIVENTSPTFNLLAKVNKCHTAFGKRLIREWMCMPLAIPRDIDNRLDAVEELMTLDSFRLVALQYMKPLPDLERLLNKVHMLGSANRKKNHPDGRAIMFEEVTYSKNKILDLLSIIRGFKESVNVIRSLRVEKPKSQFLQEIVSNFPDLDPILRKFDDAFDHAAAKKEGKIIPKNGVDSEYDEVMKDLAAATLLTERYLREARMYLKVEVKYFGTAKNRFQLEVPFNTKVPVEFELSSSRKGFKRYVSPTTKRLLEDIQRIEAKREEVLRDITRRIFEKFDKSYEKWKAGVDCLAKLDAIICLANFSAFEEGMCRPKVVYSKQPFTKIKDGRHPLISIDKYIPNSCYLGVGRPNKLPPFGSFMLLTGPNMGGKSTLMRQVALISVLAQMGCYVPASSCEMSVVDRIFTRIGATDKLIIGQSTFYIELSETSSIMRHCTKHSLVIMDELGRGTATYDGTAIAYAVACNLANRRVRTLFSTHYHHLVESIQHLPTVQLGHMACMVENECDDDPTQETVTFLYKVAPGECPKSYGFNAAKLAGLPEEVILCGHQKAKQFEAETCNLDAFRKIVQMTGNDLTLQSALQLLKI